MNRDNPRLTMLTLLMSVLLFFFHSPAHVAPPGVVAPTGTEPNAAAYSILAQMAPVVSTTVLAFPGGEGGAGVWVLPTVWSLHADGSESFVSMDGDGNIALSLYGRTGNQVQPMPPQDPVQTLCATWVDVRGVTRTVCTPVIGSTPAAVARAEVIHEAAVDRQMTKHPPRPPS